MGVKKQNEWVVERWCHVQHKSVMEELKVVFNDSLAIGIQEQPVWPMTELLCTCDGHGHKNRRKVGTCALITMLVYLDNKS